MREIGDYKYLVNLLKKIINVSVKTVDIIAELSKYSILDLEENNENAPETDFRVIAEFLSVI